MFDLADYIGKLTQVSSTSGGEYAGQCPWCGGEDRFRVWPSEGDTGRFWCRQCGRSGDGITYLREHEGLSFRKACKKTGREEKLDNGPDVTTAGEEPSQEKGGRERPPHPAETASAASKESTAPRHKDRHKLEAQRSEMKSHPPPETWQDRGFSLVTEAASRLWEETAASRSACEYLQDRGFTEETIRSASLGLVPSDRFDDPESWGREAGHAVWVPRGISIPWIWAGQMWGVNVRRPNGDVDPEAEEGWKARKYHRVAGSVNALYGAERLDGRPVVLVEGELDALAVRQETSEAAGLATGSTSWARGPRWRALLRGVPIMLVAFDLGDAGEEASRYWTEVLPSAVRWRPHVGDVAGMLEAGADIGRWVEEGLDYASGVLG